MNTSLWFGFPLKPFSYRAHTSCPLLLLCLTPLSLDFVPYKSRYRWIFLLFFFLAFTQFADFFSDRSAEISATEQWLELFLVNQAFGSHEVKVAIKFKKGAHSLF